MSKGKMLIPPEVNIEANDIIYSSILAGQTTNMIQEHLHNRFPEYKEYLSKRYVSSHAHKNRIKIKASMEKNYDTYLSDFLCKCEAIYENAFIQGQQKTALNAIKQMSDLLQLTKADTNKVDVNVKQEQNKDEEN